MKHRLSLLSTLWLTAVSCPSAYAFDIGDGANDNPSSSQIIVGRGRILPATQVSRKGLVFPRVYEDAAPYVASPVTFSSPKSLIGASNTMTMAVPSAPYSTLAPSAYSQPAAAPQISYTPAPVYPSAPTSVTAMAAAPLVYTTPAYAAPVTAPMMTAPAMRMAIVPTVTTVTPTSATPIASYAVDSSADAYPALAPAAGVPAPVQNSTRIFNPMDVPAVAVVAPQSSPAPMTLTPPLQNQTVSGAPEPLGATPLNGARYRSAQTAQTPAKVIVPNTLAALPKSSEPKEQLSRNSKAIIGTIPSKLDSAKIEKNEKFDLSRTTASVDALDLKKAGKVDAYEASGIKISVRRPGLDTNYELNRAYNALTGGDTEVAMQTYKNILSVEPVNQDALFGLASLYHRQGDVARARPLYGILLKNYPNHREGINNFLALVSDESPQEALAELERLEQRNPDFSPIPAQEALVLERLGYASEAQAKMTRAIELAPENLTYKYNLAVMMDRQRNYPEAIALYRLLLDSSSKGAQIPASADSIQRRLNHIATIANTGAVPRFDKSQTM